MTAIVNVIGIVYGFVLILAAFVRSKLLEPMRLDVLFMPQPTEQTRPVNLVFGVLVAGYGFYSLMWR